MKLKRKTAVVTGASRGIGKAIAIKLAEQNLRVALISRNSKDLRKVIGELKNPSVHRGYQCDVRDKKQVVKTFADIYERFGSVEVLVNNAGINSRKTISFACKNISDVLNQSLKGWQDELDTNLTGAYLCSYVAAHYMLKGGKGSIVNISSIKGREATSSPGYGASKAGVIKLTKDFAKTLAPHSIRVNCVLPGFIDTGLTAELSTEKKSMYHRMIPLGRFGKVEEVADTVMFLASSSSSYITGAWIIADGGYLV